MKHQHNELPIMKNQQTRRKNTRKVAPLLALAILLLTTIPIYYPYISYYIGYSPLPPSSSSSLRLCQEGSEDIRGCSPRNVNKPTIRDGSLVDADHRLGNTEEKHASKSDNIDVETQSSNQDSRDGAERSFTTAAANDDSALERQTTDEADTERTASTSADAAAIDNDRGGSASTNGDLSASTTANDNDGERSATTTTTYDNDRGRSSSINDEADGDLSATAAANDNDGERSATTTTTTADDRDGERSATTNDEATSDREMKNEESTDHTKNDSETQEKKQESSSTGYNDINVEKKSPERENHDVQGETTKKSKKPKAANKGRNDLPDQTKKVVVTPPVDKKCDLFSGDWVPNPEGPYYTNFTCREIQEHQNCLKFGRPDTEYLKWKWKPEGCELPIFDPFQFLEIVRGKSIAFVGDSVARNHMQSLICLLSRVEEPVDVSDIPFGSQFKRYQYVNYNFTIEIFWSPYLVRTTQTDEQNSSPFNLYLDEFDEKWTTKIERFDYVIISAGHWFFRPTMFYVEGKLVGCLYCDDWVNIKHLTTYFSYRRAFRTAFRAINSLENYKGITFLRTFAPSHFEGGYWNSGGDCKRKKPFRRSEASLEGYNNELYKIQTDEIKIANRLGRRKGLRYRLFDVTKAMLLRPDGHPSKYGHWPQVNVTLTNDCVHWCLPGPVDAWNDFFLELLKREELH